MPRLRVYHCSSFSEAIASPFALRPRRRADGNRFARSEAAATAAAVAAADSPRHRDRGSESPLSPELDGTVLPRGLRERQRLNK